MNVLWGLLIVAAGALLLAAATAKSGFVVYRLLVARSRMLWGDRVHRFHQLAGMLVIVFGVLVAVGVFE